MSASDDDEDDTFPDDMPASQREFIREGEAIAKQMRRMTEGEREAFLREQGLEDSFDPERAKEILQDALRSSPK